MLLRPSPLPPVQPLVAILQAVVTLLRAPTELGGQRTPSWPDDAVVEWADDLCDLRKVTPMGPCAVVVTPVIGCVYLECSLLC
jgi:hypothetical protein